MSINVDDVQVGDFVTIESSTGSKLSGTVELHSSKNNKCVVFDGVSHNLTFYKIVEHIKATPKWKTAKVIKVTHLGQTWFALGDGTGNFRNNVETWTAPWLQRLVFELGEKIEVIVDENGKVVGA